MRGQLAFFDCVSERWDAMCFHDPDKLSYLLHKINIFSGNTVLDVGTGTGVLIPFLREMNKTGKIMAIDLSSGMIEVAKKKFGNDPNICFKQMDVETAPVEGIYDHIILYSVFPHLAYQIPTVKKLVSDNLKPGGNLLIAHSQSRAELNAMHRDKDERVCRDSLMDVNLQRRLFEIAGICVQEATENEELYYLILNRS